MAEPQIIPITPELTGSAQSSRCKHFALIGAAGFVAPRHLQAIRDCGGELIAALDPHDSVGVLDSYFPDAHFFNQTERFDRFLERRRRDDKTRIDYISVCSPNFLHDAHVRLALRVGAHAICEKPLVINPWNLDQLADLEAESDGRINAVLQLRLHPGIQRLRAMLQSASNPVKHDVCLTYVTRRGAWYQSSWKGSEEKSGGLALNIGIHFFDLLVWLFGRVERSTVHLAGPSRVAGVLHLERATAKWFLSIDSDDLPEAVRRQNKHAHRSLTIDGQETDLSNGFGDLHSQVYREVLAGRGFGIEDARPSIDLVYALRQSPESTITRTAHPFLRRQSVA